MCIVSLAEGVNIVEGVRTMFRPDTPCARVSMMGLFSSFAIMFQFRLKTISPIISDIRYPNQRVISLAALHSPEGSLSIRYRQNLRVLLRTRLSIPLMVLTESASESTRLLKACFFLSIVVSDMGTLKK